MPALEVRNLSVRRGGLRVVNEVSLEVPLGKIVTIVGLNGAGKSSLLAALGGLLPIDGGSLHFDGTDLTRRPTWERCRRGLVLIPERRRLFPGMSVLDNLMVGAHLIGKADVRLSLDRVFELFPALKEKQHTKAKELSGGQQQMVAVGRGLMAKPKVLMLDEPSEGLAPTVVSQMFETISTLSAELGLGVLLAEQNAAIARFSDVLVFMSNGQIEESEAASDSGLTVDIARVVFE